MIWYARLLLEAIAVAAPGPLNPALNAVIPCKVQVLWESYCHC